MESSVVRLQGLDKFYTTSFTVDICLNELHKINPIDSYNLVIEPSAGNGSFLHKINNKNKIGLDIEPEHQDIIKMDFFEYKPDNITNVLVLGNPPFGKNSSLAVKFFNHSAKFCDTIAFVLPRIFRRTSIQNKLDKNFHLIVDIELSTKPCCFTPSLSVKCCFQVYKRSEIKREFIKLPVSCDDWEFIKYGPKDDKGQPTVPKNIDFAMKAYGSNCGEIKLDNLDVLRPKSWHFIKSNINKETLIDNFKKLDYNFTMNTARQNSLGKAELVQLYLREFKSPIFH